MHPTFPTEQIAADVVTSMTNEKVLSISRMTTGDQHFVFAAQTEKFEYVIRMTTPSQKHKFISAIYWQEKLLPLGVPLARFINVDIECRYSPFPALLMMRLPGDDLCNVYENLSAQDKRNLANSIVKIQGMTNTMPDGVGYGISDSYEKIPEKSWYEFIVKKLKTFKEIIKQNVIFSDSDVDAVITIANELKEDFNTIRARPFLWDASERNVIINAGTISGIVDVDEICFGDPLLVLGLTYVALENEGHDTTYCDYWSEILALDNKGQLRLLFYRLFYTIVFMRKHAMTTANDQKVQFDVQRLKNMFQQALNRIKEFNSL